MHMAMLHYLPTATMPAAVLAVVGIELCRLVRFSVYSNGHYHIIASVCDSDNDDANTSSQISLEGQSLQADADGLYCNKIVQLWRFIRYRDCSVEAPKNEVSSVETICVMREFAGRV